MKRFPVAALGATIVLAALQVAPAQAAKATPKPHFPVTVTADGYTTTVTRMPKRIVSLSPSGTEDLFAVGAGKQVIAVDDYSNFPKNAPMSKLSAFTPNLEAIAAMKPDLVVLNADATKAADVRAGLVMLHIPLYMEKAPAGLSGAYLEMRQLGALTGHAAQATALIQRMQRQIKGIIASVKITKPVRIFWELDNTLYSVTSKTFIGQVVKSFNPAIVNIADAAAGADASGYPQLSAEYLIAANPQVVFLADAQYGESKPTVAARAGWSAVDAVQQGNIVALPNDIPSRWGPRLVQLYRLIGNALAKVA